MRRLSQASLNDSSKTKLTPTATANETRSPRGRARAKMLATVPKMRPTARLPNTRRSSNSVWSTCGRSKRRRDAHRITRPGRIPRRNATRKSTFEAMEAVKKARALLKNAAGRLSSLTTGNASLWSAGRAEPDVDAREAGPGPVSRLRGAHASGPDGGRHPRFGPGPHVRGGQRTGPRGMGDLRRCPKGDEGTQPGGPRGEPCDPSDPHASPGPPGARPGRRVPQRPEAARLRGPASGRPAARGSTETRGDHGEGSGRDAQTRPGLDGHQAGVDFHTEPTGAGP